LGQGLSLHELEDQVGAAVPLRRGVLDPVDARDVGVVEGGEEARFALEAAQA
jgi:hypothetical protein